MFKTNIAYNKQNAEVFKPGSYCLNKIEIMFFLQISCGTEQFAFCYFHVTFVSFSEEDTCITPNPMLTFLCANISN